jgi:D-tyrosyl-tRNA(Tyr) deacylase
MIATIQRVTETKVMINDKTYSEISNGYLILLGIYKEDSEFDIDKLVEKIINLRVMADEEGKMNKSIIDTKGEIMVVSQFTLCANLKGGRRPDFFPAMPPVEAEKLYNLFIKKLKAHNLQIKSGQFAAHMKIELTNDGPVTFILDSKNI